MLDDQARLMEGPENGREIARECIFIFSLKASKLANRRNGGPFKLRGRSDFLENVATDQRRGGESRIVFSF